MSSISACRSLPRRCRGSRWSTPQSRPGAPPRRDFTPRGKSIGCRLIRSYCSSTERRGRCRRAAHNSPLAQSCSTASATRVSRAMEDQATTMRRHHRLPSGAEPTPDGVRFRLWAPRAEAVSVQLEGAKPATCPMTSEPGGWFSLTTAKAGPGSLYRYLVDGRAFPDPASPHQPEGVHGPSEVVDPLAYHWSDIGWHGRPWQEIVLY